MAGNGSRLGIARGGRKPTIHEVPPAELRCVTTLPPRFDYSDYRIVGQRIMPNGHVVLELRRKSGGGGMTTRRTCVRCGGHQRGAGRWPNSGLCRDCRS